MYFVHLTIFNHRLGDDVRLALQHVQSILSQLYILVGVKMAVDDTYTVRTKDADETRNETICLDGNL